MDYLHDLEETNTRIYVPLSWQSSSCRSRAKAAQINSLNKIIMHLRGFFQCDFGCNHTLFDVGQRSLISSKRHAVSFVPYLSLRSPKEGAPASTHHSSMRVSIVNFTYTVTPSTSAQR